MKKLLTGAAAIALTLSIGFGHLNVQPGCAFISPAHAQADPDHDAILTVLTGMKRDINRMIALVERHRNGAVTIGQDSVTLTAGQQTEILAIYNTLKADLAGKYQQLP